MKKKVERIQLNNRQFKKLAEKYFSGGDMFSALRYARKAFDRSKPNGDIYILLSDIYENMGLYPSAINNWFKFMDNCDEEDLPDIYEGLAVSFLNVGNEGQSAYYYNKLLDVDDSLTEENKSEIVDLFSREKKDRFRFVYPPELADYTKELREGSIALKSGDLEKSIAVLSQVPKGAKGYEIAREMQAVSYLLQGNSEKAEEICIEIVQAYPENIQAAATLSAVYTEQGRNEESRALALELCKRKNVTTEQRYKIATVCCENDLHEEAYRHFSELEKEIPYDGSMLYFKAVAAYKSGRTELAIRDLEKLCIIYPDAAVAKYYLKRLRRYVTDKENETPPNLTYFYRVPYEERELRCRALAQIGKYSKQEAESIALLLSEEGIFEWCFDEMDGMEKDLQYLAVVIAEHAGVFSFLRDVLLDSEVKDVLKVEILRMLFLRNEAHTFGVVIYNIYRKVTIRKIRLGKKGRRRFLEGYAKVASKFAIVDDEYAKRICGNATSLYDCLAEYERYDLMNNPDNIACAIYILSGLKEFGKSPAEAARVFSAEPAVVEEILKLVVL